MATITGTDNSETLSGTILADIIDGKGGNDTIHGKAGGDKIRGGTGADIMFGEGGDDTFRVFAGETAANEVYDGGNGTDTLEVSGNSDFRGSTLTSIEQLRFVDSPGAAVTAQFKAASIGGAGLASNLVLFGGGGTDHVNITMFDATSIDLSGFTYLNWGPGDDITINGDESAETFKGSWATDVIQAGLGVDTVLAGGGDDIINVNRTQAGDVYNGGTGSDTLLISNSVFDGGVTDLTGATLISIEGLIFTPSPAGDFMEARFSADQFANGEVSSSLFVHSQDSDVEQVRILMGTETVFSAASFTFAGFGATDSVQIVGSAGNDSITGSSVNDGMFGNDGQDVLLGGDGNDTLEGGTGNDFMFGGAGDDVYKVGDAGDVAAEVLIGSDPGGHDVVNAQVDATLTAFIEDLNLVGNADLSGTGNALGNSIDGTGGDNVLRGLDGADRLIGGAGRDQLFGGAGNDRFTFNSIADSVVGSERDRIRDFAGGDKIVLSPIDANETLAGNQAFVIDLDGSFSTGEIRLVVSGSDTIIALNTDADAGADMQIAVVGVTNLGDTSFIL